jgi:polyhydroxybutyrate depolymerase
MKNATSPCFKLLASACLAAPCIAGAANIASIDMPRPEGARHYLLATPGTPSPGKRPLVILLHGHKGSAAYVLGQGRMAAPMSVWLKIADREQVLVAAPDGARGSDHDQGWNDCRADAATSPKTDDTGFIKAIIDKAIAENNVDPARVYVMGMSNGGFMTFRLGVELGPKLAGIATIAAGMAANSVCPAASTPLSALIVNGTADPIVPYVGRDTAMKHKGMRGTTLGAEESVAVWRKLDKLPDTAKTDAIAHLNAKDTTQATRSVWGEDPHKLQVEFIRVENGGHTEPSVSQHHSWLLSKVLGPQNADIEIAEEAWAFFKDKRAGLAP